MSDTSEVLKAHGITAQDMVQTIAVMAVSAAKAKSSLCVDIMRRDAAIGELKRRLVEKENENRKLADALHEASVRDNG